MVLIPVPQLDEMGCGVACVGFLIRRPREKARATYERAKKIFDDLFDDARAKRRGYTIDMIVAALHHPDAGFGGAKRRGFGCRPSQRRVALIKEHQDCIVKVRRGDEDRHRHYIVHRGSQFVDSLDKKEPAGPQREGWIHARWPPGWVALSYITTSR